MIRKTRLFTPGPTPLLPAAQFAMAAADIHHRTPEFRALFSRVLVQLSSSLAQNPETSYCFPRRAPVQWKPPFQT
jgi:aspartate aminotransferase-like enzyme